MKGWKTWLGGALIIASGAIDWYQTGNPDGFVASIGAAFGVWGIGHKVEKSKAVTP